MNPVHQTVNAPSGRTFVVGDLHGSYNLLMQFMGDVKFNTETDLMVSVGDLVDRGPFNVECLALLEQPWFRAVYGNHEDLMVAHLTGNTYLGNWWKPNGGGWYHNLDALDTKYVNTISLPLVQQLPLVLTVCQKDGSQFHVVHAELMSEVPLTDEDFAIDGTLDNPCNLQSPDGDTAIWGRGFFGGAYGVNVTEHMARKWRTGLTIDRYSKLFNDRLSTIYSGHSVMRRPTRICSVDGRGGQVNLDTRAYEAACQPVPSPWAGLTITEPLTNKFWTVNLEEGVKEVECLVI